MTFLMITGLLRVPEVFSQMIPIYERLLTDGMIDGVIISTWLDQTSTFRAVINESASAPTKFEIVATEPPYVSLDASVFGNPFHQLLALENGLTSITDSQSLVIKTRCDITLSEPFLRSLIINLPEKLPSNSTASRFALLDERVWVPWMELTSPFHLEDLVFASTARTLRKLINYDCEIIVKSSPIAQMSHHSFYYNIFKKQFHQILHFFNLARKHRLGLTFNGNEVRCWLIYLLSTASVYRYILALYWNLIRENFWVYSGYQDFENPILQHTGGGGRQINTPSFNTSNIDLSILSPQSLFNPPFSQCKGSAYFCDNESALDIVCNWPIPDRGSVDVAHEYYQCKKTFSTELEHCLIALKSNLAIR